MKIKLNVQKVSEGGGGTSDYNNLNNKPSINGETLSGDKTSLQLGLQDTLVSGQNIKTINGNSILGNGNIEIEGGSGGTTNHAELDNLDYEHSGHTGFQPAGNYVEDNNYVHTDNNFTDTYKSNVEANTTAKHTHSNKSVLDDISSTDITNWNNKSNFSGSYEDLSNKPTIPSEVTETTVSNWGFTKNTGTYSKPSEGIPKNDLSSDVQTSLGKADTALQSYTEQYTGTITGITMNGASKGTIGVVDLGTVITSHQDLSDYELKPTTISSSETTVSITPENNKIYQCGTLTSLTITNPPATGVYSIIFTSGAIATTTVIPNTMLGLEDFAAEANTIYEINVFDNRAVVGSWEVSV